MSVSRLPQRALGNTGMRVSTLGLGTVKIGRNQGVKYPDAFELPDDETVTRLLDLARELGINLLDTAPAYGCTEERLGGLLKHRQDWLLCTKTGEEFSGGKSRFDFSAQHTRHSVERSLQRLRTDYLDIVLVHSDGNDLDVINHSDCLDTLARMKQEGLIRSIGFSGKTPEGGLLALQYSDIVMVTFNPQHTSEREVISRAHQLNKGVLIKKALASGHAAGHEAAGGTANSLQFCLSEPGVSSVVVGTINAEHLRANAKKGTEDI